MSLAAVLLVTLSCSSIRPVPVSAGDICTRCGRSIDDVRLAGEVIDTGDTALKFKTAGCMAQYLKSHPEAVKAVFVTDYKTGRMIPAGKAVFVRATIDEVRGERDYLAFATMADAQPVAARNQSSVVDWIAVRQLSGSAR
jgi:hypothetical protein